MWHLCMFITYADLQVVVLQLLILLFSLFLFVWFITEKDWLKFYVLRSSLSISPFLIFAIVLTYVITYIQVSFYLFLVLIQQFIIKVVLRLFWLPITFFKVKLLKGILDDINISIYQLSVTVWYIFPTSVFSVICFYIFRYVL